MGRGEENEYVEFLFIIIYMLLKKIIKLSEKVNVEILIRFLISYYNKKRKINSIKH